MIKNRTLTLTLDQEDLEVAIHNYVRQATREFDGVDIDVKVRYTINSDPTYDGPGFGPQILRGAIVEVQPKQYELDNDWSVPLVARIDAPIDGMYAGKQSGYEVVYRADSNHYVCKAETGARSLNVPVTVHVTDGKTSVSMSHRTPR